MEKRPFLLSIPHTWALRLESPLSAIWTCQVIKKNPFGRREKSFHSEINSRTKFNEISHLRRFWCVSSCRGRFLSPVFVWVCFFLHIYVCRHAFQWRPHNNPRPIVSRYWFRQFINKFVIDCAYFHEISFATCLSYRLLFFASSFLFCSFPLNHTFFFVNLPLPIRFVR